MLLSITVYELFHIFYHCSFAYYGQWVFSLAKKCYNLTLRERIAILLSDAPLLSYGHFSISPCYPMGQISILLFSSFSTYGRAFQWWWPSWDMAAYCGALMRLQMSCWVLIRSNYCILKEGLSAMALYIVSLLMADPVCFYRGDPLCSPLDSIPGPLDPELHPLLTTPRRVQG